jgi:hypothetical protein
VNRLQLVPIIFSQDRLHRWPAGERTAEQVAIRREKLWHFSSIELLTVFYGCSTPLS